MRFVILALPRTGSSHLTDLLNNQEDILCNGEIFHPRGVYVRWPKPGKHRAILQELKELRANDPVGFAERVLATDFGRPHVGFKIFDRQSDVALNAFVNDKSLFKIVLYRGNLLASYASKLLANASGEWDKKSSDAARTREKVPFDADRFLRFHRRCVEYYHRIISRLIETEQKYYLLSYDGINDLLLFSSLVAAIGGNTRAIRFQSQHLRQNPSNIISRFSNPSDVERFLEERKLMHWRFEGETSFKPLKTVTPGKFMNPGDRSADYKEALS